MCTAAHPSLTANTTESCARDHQPAIQQHVMPWSGHVARMKHIVTCKDVSHCVFHGAHDVSCLLLVRSQAGSLFPNAKQLWSCFRTWRGSVHGSATSSGGWQRLPPCGAVTALGQARWATLQHAQSSLSFASGFQSQGGKLGMLWI